MASLDVAIRLVTQATNQDSAKNYDEAARCYREAIVGFRTVAQRKNISPAVKDAILSKCSLYEDRLKKIDRYLLSKADLSKLFRDCVAFHQQQQQIQDNRRLSRSSSSSILISDDDEIEPFNPDSTLRQGLEKVEAGKRQDNEHNFAEALRHYDEGVDLLLRVAQHCKLVGDKRAETILFKSLLIQERMEAIRCHLESGKPIRDRRENVFDLSLSTSSLSLSGGFDSCTASPEPFKDELNEDQVLLMEEIRSNLSLSPSRRESLSSSRHSLYPTICEIKRCSSILSEDLAVSKNQNTSCLIPLADLDTELQLSSESLDIFKERLRTSSGSVDSRHASVSLTSSLNDVHLLGQQYSFDNSYERDCNITELTYENSGLDIHTYKAYLNHSLNNDSGSDSGIGDPSGSSIKGGGSSATRTPSNSPVSLHSLEKSSPAASINSGSYQDFANLFKEGRQSTKSSKAPSPITVLSSAPATRTSSLKRTQKVNFQEEDELRVVSTEEVIDGQIMAKTLQAKPEVYQAAADTRRRPEYIPPRALAYRPGGEEDGVNKGCYYFVACLDSFWIL